jgi:O-methyltransferase involved in polyketide biosynthesis
MTAKSGDLSVTALYTSQVWAWGGLSYAHLFTSPDAKRVFGVTNVALAVAGMFNHKLSPLRHSLLHRHTMIDHLMRESGARQVIELAAGFSRRGAAATNNPHVHYAEIDLPHVIGRKRELLKRTEEGRAVLARSGLRLVEADVETVALEQFVTPGESVFVIAEGLLMYLDTDARRELFTKVRRLAATTGELRFVFDLTQVAQKPGVVGRVLAAAMKRSTGGRGFERCGTWEDIVTALQHAGFDEVAVVTASEIARAWGLPDPDRRTQVTLFVASCTVDGSLGGKATVAGQC